MSAQDVIGELNAINNIFPFKNVEFHTSDISKPDKTTMVNMLSEKCTYPILNLSILTSPDADASRMVTCAPSISKEIAKENQISTNGPAEGDQLTGARKLGSDINLLTPEPIKIILWFGETRMYSRFRDWNLFQLISNC